VFYLARLGLAIQPLRIAFHANFERRIDVDFDEFALAHQFARHAPLRSEGRDKRNKHDQSGIYEQLCRLANPANVFHAIDVCEAEIAIEPVADIVAVEQIGVSAFGEERAFDQVRNGGFARSRKTGEPEHDGPLPLLAGARLLADVARLPMDIGRPPEAEIDHSRADGRVGESVDQDEAAGVPVVVIGIECDRVRCREIGVAHLVEMEGLRGVLIERVDVDLVLEGGDLNRHGRGSELQRYCRPGRSSSSAIQSRCAANCSETSGRSSGAVRISPREMSTSSDKTSVTAMPATASSRSPSMVTIRLTAL